MNEQHVPSPEEQREIVDASADKSKAAKGAQAGDVQKRVQQLEHQVHELQQDLGGLSHRLDEHVKAIDSLNHAGHLIAERIQQLGEQLTSHLQGQEVKLDTLDGELKHAASLLLGQRTALDGLNRRVADAEDVTAYNERLIDRLNQQLGYTIDTVHVQTQGLRLAGQSITQLNAATDDLDLRVERLNRRVAVGGLNDPEVTLLIDMDLETLPDLLAHLNAAANVLARPDLTLNAVQAGHLERRWRDAARSGIVQNYRGPDAYNLQARFHALLDQCIQLLQERSLVYSALP